MMTKFTLHTIESAPTASKEYLEWAVKTYGFVVNILAVMAEAPATIKTYFEAFHDFMEGSITAGEAHLMMLALSVHMKCSYYATTHTALGLRDGSIPPQLFESVRNGAPIEDPRYAALCAFAIAVFENRDGNLQPELERFLAAGYSRAQALEVIAGVGVKVLANNVALVTQLPLDNVPGMEAFVWPRVAAAKE